MFSTCFFLPLCTKNKNRSIGCWLSNVWHFFYSFFLFILFSLRQGDLIRRSCRSVGPQFCNFSKRGFESKNSNLSNTTKLILLDSLLQEVTAIVRLPNPKFSTVVRLPNPESNSVVWLHNWKFSAVVRLQNPKLSAVVRLPNSKMNTVVRLPNPSLSTVVWLRNPKFKTMGAGDTFLMIQNLFYSFSNSGRQSRLQDCPADDQKILKLFLDVNQL